MIRLIHAHALDGSLIRSATSPESASKAQVPGAAALENRYSAPNATRTRSFAVSIPSNQISNLATASQVSSLEFSQIQATVMHGLSVGNDVLKQLHAEMSLDKVEKLMDQTREGIEQQRVRDSRDMPLERLSWLS